jgi:SAM-dependent methyltransferase
MKPDLLGIICCPDCNRPFQLDGPVSEKDEIISGSLRCGGCETDYPIVDGLPVILRDDPQTRKTREAFERQWVWQKAGHFEDKTIYGQPEDEEMSDFKSAFNLSDLGALSERVVLDAGCGSGRLTSNIGREAKNSRVVGIDISGSARVAYNRCRDLPNVHIIQCDLRQSPFRPGSFDYVWCEGVIHHTPSSLQSFGRLDDLLSSEGMLYIWVYPNYIRSPYRMARDILWRPYAMPAKAVYCVSWLLAFPLCATCKCLRLAKLVKRDRKLRTLVFQFFDNLSPEFQHRHSREEVHDWFESHDYGEVRFIGDIGAVGRKSRTSSAESKTVPTGGG